MPRLGGDEFVVLPRAGRTRALEAADEIREALTRADALPCGMPGLSIGVAVLPDHAGTGEELMSASDTALYEAKPAAGAYGGQHDLEVAVPG